MRDPGSNRKEDQQQRDDTRLWDWARLLFGTDARAEESLSDKVRVNLGRARTRVARTRLRMRMSTDDEDDFDGSLASEVLAALFPYATENDQDGRKRRLGFEKRMQLLYEERRAVFQTRKGTPVMHKDGRIVVSLGARNDSIIPRSEGDDDEGEEEAFPSERTHRAALRFLSEFGRDDAEQGFGVWDLLSEFYVVRHLMKGSDVELEQRALAAKSAATIDDENDTKNSSDDEEEPFSYRLLRSGGSLTEEACGSGERKCETVFIELRRGPAFTKKRWMIYGRSRPQRQPTMAAARSGSSVGSYWD